MTPTHTTTDRYGDLDDTHRAYYDNQPPDDCLLYTSPSPRD